MAELVNGDGTIPQATGGWAQKLISSSTNTSPITVTFCSAHCSNEGDTWGIEGHQTNTNANGNWRVHVTGTQTLQLVGSTGNGVGGLTGYGIDYSVNPLIQVADDLEAASASNNNTPIEALANVTPYLYKRAGKYSLYDRVVIASDGSTLASYPNSWTSQSVPSDSAWHIMTATETVYPNAIGLNDFLVVEIDFMLASGLTVGTIGAAVGFSISGGAWFVGGSFEGNGVPQFIAGNSVDQGIHTKYSGQVKLASLPLTNGGLSVGVMAFQNSGSPLTVQFYKPYQIVVTHYRSNA